MKLTNRVLLGALAVVGVHVLVMVYLVDRQLGSRLQDEAVAGLAREAHVVAAHWTNGADPFELAHTDGRALGHRVTLIRPGGVVVGDADFDRDGMAKLENHARRPEVVAANGEAGIGVATRPSASDRDDQLYVAVRTPRGIARVSMPIVSLTNTISDAQNAVTLAGVVALAFALIVAWSLSRTITTPLIELRNVARAIADGDLGRRAHIDAPGELGELALSLREMSVQLAARDAARRADEALLVQLTESLNEGVVGVDSTRHVIRINETGRRLLGVRQPIPFSADLIPRDRALRDALQAAFDGNTTEGSEATLLGRTVNITARPLESGGAVLALLDLTRLRRLESVRRDFVANVSHELRTPLTIVGGFAETLVHDDPPVERRKQFAERILGNTRRMQRIVDDLLDLSRIESGSWTPNPVKVDLAAVAADVNTAARDVAGAKGIRLEASIAPGAREIWADPTAIRQVLGNLVDNAVRHTAAGHVAIFSLRRADGGITVGVRDTGSGIAPEHLPRIFERFYRVDPGRSRDEGGTGLGLSIVKHLVEAHGGTVRAESTVGVGTTIAVHFPAAAPSDTMRS
jgi:two-component system, OmpR family, phosphate regulon sensor histidine kinase PhoR